ncbi:winged helix-turn-helix domain-containing protein [Paenibacillus aurantius]|uniref:Winged helix-turn-helix domain-containing protein n=1 Tax=Paenibacillus aurantius TaxID=2918900 RepID=A0AA96LAL2_9BACL|nr:winged helix-turn-helix domain-containing protein [Paenibacillus aurantius]WNQ09675.1 winged helix-turn-helix domain-containing protein [Paenibacillus aurantius]
MSFSTSYKIAFQFNPLFEFASAASFVANKDQFIKIFHELGEDLDSIGFIEQMDGQLSRFLRSELNFFFVHPFKQTSLGYETIVNMAIINTSPITVTEGINTLERMASTQLVARMVKSSLKEQFDSFLSGHQWSDVQRDRDLMIRQLNKIDGANKEIIERLLECTMYPDEAKQRYHTLCKTFYNSIYSPLEEQIVSISRGGAEKYSEQYKQNPLKFIDNYLVEATEEKLKQPTQIHVSIFDQACSTCNSGTSKDELFNWIRLGIHLDRLLENKPLRKQADLFLKLLSDSKRILIIEALAERPWYGQELSKKLNLTPAAISYHMGFFFSLDLVRVSKSDQRHYYLLDKEKMKTYFSQTQEILLKKHD